MTGLENEPGINGGLVFRRGPAPAEGQSVNSFVCTIEVPDLDEYMDRVLRAGGRVAVPKMPITWGGLAGLLPGQREQYLRPDADGGEDAIGQRYFLNMMCMMDTELSIILVLQEQDWAIPIMKFASFLGSLEFMLLSMPFLFWCWDAKQGFRVGLMLVTSHGLNAALKIALHSPRPYWIDPDVRAWCTQPSFGMPSGHAQNAVSIWGLTAHLIHKPWAYVLAAGTCLLIGLSRAYLGVHFPSDVIAGWAIGALLLGSFIWAMPVLEERIRRMNLKRQMLLATLASFAIIALYLLGLAGIGGWQMPPVWAANSLAATVEPIDPFSPVDAFSAAGMILGICSGYASF